MSEDEITELRNSIPDDLEINSIDSQEELVVDLADQANISDSDTEQADKQIKPHMIPNISLSMCDSKSNYMVTEEYPEHLNTDVIKPYVRKPKFIKKCNEIKTVF